MWATRPRYRERVDSTATLLPIKGFREQLEFGRGDEPLISSSANVQKLTAAVVRTTFPSQLLFQFTKRCSNT